MKIFLIVLILGLVISLGLNLYKTKKRKEKIIIQSANKVDNKPFTKDNIMYVYGKGIKKITYRSLIFGDVDGDKITNVRFYDFTHPLYKDEHLTVEYKENEELPIEFSLFVNILEDENFSVSYDVKSNNLWSNG